MLSKCYPMTVGSRTVTRDVIDSQSPPLRRLIVDEYHKMIEAGILGEDEHVQLVDGFLVQMTPQGRPHAFVIQRLNRLLILALGDDYAVLPQLPLTLGHDSEPEPDLAVVQTEDSRSRKHHPRTALLVIEVAGDSLRFDRKTKGALYARFGIPEYWIVNVEANCVEVHRDPDRRTKRYRTLVTARAGDTLACVSVPRLSIAVADVFGEV